MHPAARFRLVAARAGALGAVATAIGAIGHVHAGGDVPDLGRSLAVWLAASVLSAGFLISEVGWLRISALLLAEQLLVHTGLMWLASTGSSMAPMPGMPDMPGMSMPMSTTPMSLAPSLDMVASHAVAAVIAGLWLWRGERALWELIALAGKTIRVLIRRFVIAPTRPIAIPAVPLTRPRASSWDLRIAREVPRRGPPAALAL